jgi:hypothetical protein
VTVRAKHAKVFESVILPYAVDVVEMKHQFRAEPLRNSAFIALVAQVTAFQQQSADLAASLYHRALFWKPPFFTLSNRAPFFRIGPRGGGKSKPRHTFVARMLSIVIFLNFNPAISRHTETIAGQCANWVANNANGDVIAQLGGPSLPGAAFVIQPEGGLA